MAAVPPPTSNAWNFSWRCAGAASATRPCCAPWTRCRANISSRRTSLESAYADQALPIACGQTISQPYVVAYMTEQLEVEPQHRVLEIGTGSGYQAAILSRLAREVVSIERYRTLAETARDRLKTLGYANVTVLVGDGLAGAPELAPFDRIIVTAAAEEVPRSAVRRSLPKAARCCCRSVRATARNILSSSPKPPDGGLDAREADRGALCAAFAGASARTVAIMHTMSNYLTNLAPTLKALFTATLFSHSSVLLRASE